MCFQSRLKDLICAGYSAVLYNTSEEFRVEQGIQDTAAKLNAEVREKFGIPATATQEELPEEYTDPVESICTWSCTSGLRRVWPEDRASQISDSDNANEMLEALYALPPNTLTILRDFHHHANDENPDILRGLRDLFKYLKATGGMIVMISPHMEVHDDLKKEIVVEDYSLPTKRFYTKIMSNVVPLDAMPTGEELETCLEASKGLTGFEAENVYSLSLVKTKGLCPAIITDHKKTAIKGSGQVEWFDSDLTIADCGGMENIKKWLNERSRAFTKEAKEFGIPMPRGILIIGLSGCGKSLIAKICSAIFDKPLIRCDFSACQGSLVGETEKKTREMLSLLDAISPCVALWDEFEKAVGGSEGHQGDGGATQRAKGSLLTWMNERTAPVFIVATANNISQLPPEFLRKGGRFDEIFFVDLPNKKERKEIWDIHLKNYRPDTKFDLKLLSDNSDGFTGAEIATCVGDGMYKAFAAGSDMTTDHVLVAANQLIPLSKTMEEKMNAMREWAKDRARPASKSDSKKGKGGGGRRKVIVGGNN